LPYQSGVGRLRRDHLRGRAPRTNLGPGSPRE
jgi:hypothetical protein